MTAPDADDKSSEDALSPGSSKGSAEEEAAQRTGNDPAPAPIKEQVEGEGDVGAEGLERRDREP